MILWALCFPYNLFQKINIYIYICNNMVQSMPLTFQVTFIMQESKKVTK